MTPFSLGTKHKRQNAFITLYSKYPLCYCNYLIQTHHFTSLWDLLSVAEGGGVGTGTGGGTGPAVM